jgi:hypothetical protein
MPDLIIYREPCIHIVVRNFLEHSLKSKILGGLQPLLPHAKKVYQQDPDGVDRSHDEDGKRGVWAYPFFKENPALDDSCLSLFEAEIWTPELRAAYRETGDMLFHSYDFTNSSEILLSRYEAGGLMEWHFDQWNLCSASYIFSMDDTPHEGGDFVLGEIGIENDAMKTKTYSFEDNFLILFPSKATHRVTPTKQERYSLQYWADCRFDRPQKSPYA